LLSGFAELDALAGFVELAAEAVFVGSVVILDEDALGKLDSGGCGDVPVEGTAMILPLASLILSAYEPRALKTDVLCGGLFAAVLGMSLLRGVRVGGSNGPERSGKDEREGGDCTASIDGIGRER
jgi:hypothetical protein